MSDPRLDPGPPAGPDDLARARYAEELLHGAELERVRAAAQAWRNGLAGLLLGLAGFGLLRGRSDIGELAATPRVAVGVLLVLALLAGGAGAWLVLRAAHGTPKVVDARKLPGRVPLEHQMAQEAARDLRRAIVLVFAHAVFLVAAVGVTWYAPGAAAPRVQVTTDGLTVCGTVLEVEGGQMTVVSGSAAYQIGLDSVRALRAVTSCGSG